MKKVAILIDPQQGWNAKDEYLPGNTLEVRRFDDGTWVMSEKPVPWNGGGQAMDRILGKTARAQ